jgi:TetR/AcrR family transcriptional regulator
MAPKAKAGTGAKAKTGAKTGLGTKADPNTKADANASTPTTPSAPEAVPAATRKPRRSPAPAERLRDAERTRGLLLDAALEVFAAKGFAGARVQDIADRAGVAKNLVTYYFGGKDGLYLEMRRLWAERETSFAGPEVPLDELVVRYLRRNLTDRRPARLMAWRSLETDAGDDFDDGSTDSDVATVRDRQARGELAAHHDPAAVLLALTGMIMIPQTMPALVRRLFDAEPESPEFTERYAEQLRRFVRLLAEEEAGCGRDRDCDHDRGFEG